MFEVGDCLPLCLDMCCVGDSPWQHVFFGMNPQESHLKPAHRQNPPSGGPLLPTNDPVSVPLGLSGEPFAPRMKAVFLSRGSAVRPVVLSSISTRQRLHTLELSKPPSNIYHSNYTSGNVGRVRIGRKDIMDQKRRFSVFAFLVLLSATLQIVSAQDDDIGLEPVSESSGARG
jgi:hypothetical protein